MNDDLLNAPLDSQGPTRGLHPFLPPLLVKAKYFRFADPNPNLT